MFAVLSAIIVILIIAYLALEFQVLGPIRSIHATINRRKSGDATARVSLSTTDEIAAVARTLNETLDNEDAQGRKLSQINDQLTQAALRAATTNIAKLRADERKLRQIPVNLLTNSIKFTKPGETVKIRAWCRRQSGFVFQIIDSGIGIAPEDIPKALSQFGQVESDLNRKYDGTGLGLPLTKALVELQPGLTPIAAPRRYCRHRPS